MSASMRCSSDGSLTVCASWRKAGRAAAPRRPPACIFAASAWKIAGNVRLRRALGDVECRGDFLVRIAFAEQSQHFELAQREPQLRRRGVRARVRFRHENAAIEHAADRLEHVAHGKRFRNEARSARVEGAPHQPRLLLFPEMAMRGTSGWRSANRPSAVMPSMPGRRRSTSTSSMSEALSRTSSASSAVLARSISNPGSALPNALTMPSR